MKNTLTATVVAAVLGLGACNENAGITAPTAPTSVAHYASSTAPSTPASGAASVDSDTNARPQPTQEIGLLEQPGTRSARDANLHTSFTLTSYNATDVTYEWKIRVIRIENNSDRRYRVRVQTTRSFPGIGQHEKTYPISAGQSQDYRGLIIPGTQYCARAEEIHIGSGQRFPYSLGCVTTPACRAGWEYDSTNPTKCRRKTPSGGTPSTPSPSPTCSDTRYSRSTIEAHHAGETLSSVYSYRSGSKTGCVHLYLPSGLDRNASASPTINTQASECAPGFYVRKHVANAAICREFGLY